MTPEVYEPTFKTVKNSGWVPSATALSHCGQADMCVKRDS